MHYRKLENTELQNKKTSIIFCHPEITMTFFIFEYLLYAYMCIHTFLSLKRDHFYVLFCNLFCSVNYLPFSLSIHFNVI